MSRLNNKVALVTGAAQGIGRAIAALFVKEQATVIMTDLHNQPEDPLPGVDYYPLDVASERCWRDVVALIKKKYGRLDILVNNAGVTDLRFCQGTMQDPEHVDMACWDQVHDVNLKGVVLGCKYGIGLMKESQAASIVNISSVAGMIGIPGSVAYASSKAAVRNHTKSVAVHCAEKRYHIRCNSIHPGAIDTEIWKPMYGDNPKHKDVFMGMLAKGIPMNRLGTAREVAYAALYLASDESSYVTGSELTIDGGLLATSVAGELD